MPSPNGLHMVGFQGSVAQNAVLANIPLLTDVVFANTAAGYLPPFAYKLMANYVQADAASVAYINTPTLRIPQFPYLSNLDLAADPPNLPPMNLYGDSGPLLPATDPFNITLSRAGSGTSVCASLNWVSRQRVTPVKKDIRTVRATASITRVASAWASGSLTIADVLPSGTYEIHGMAAFGTNLLAARLIFPDQIERPGCLAQVAIGEYSWDYFRYGNLGVWGSFSSYALPVLEIIGFGANTSQTVYIDIVKVG